MVTGFLGVLLWAKKLGKWLVILSFSGLWLISTEPVRDVLMQPLQQAYPPLTVSHMSQWQQAPGTAIVLLGGGIYENAPEFDGMDVSRDAALQRLIFAAQLQQSSGLVVYASGGTPLNEGETPEGEVMRQWLMRLGVPDDKIEAENFANTTWDNALLVKAMLQQRGVHRVLLVTNAWHMPRSVRCFEKQDLQVVPVPVDYAGNTGGYDVRSWLPQAAVLNDSSIALHEYLGLLWYEVKYSDS